ncbi:hypothetical protein [Streptomyces sp. MH60]|uniref:hypothetical protein n=1 Tax=Streptomyces sp. MH60 TaxID=1940758 RepID=UPI000CEDDC60|nr:hypothetical protein [Streptomyces sp. MH60]PPS89439.1 hypothetical protein BZZ08_01585 [Streptomyces sp. MH60]
MSDVKELAELWTQYAAAQNDISKKEPVRNLQLRKEDGGDELLFLTADGSLLDGDDAWRQIKRSAADVAYQVKAVQDVERCRALLDAALHSYQELSTVGLLMPEAIEAIGRHLASAGHTDTAAVSAWESYGPVQQYDTKGA